MLNERPCQTASPRVQGVRKERWRSVCVPLSLGRGSVEVSACLGQELSFILAFFLVHCFSIPLRWWVSRLKKFAGCL